MAEKKRQEFDGKTKRAAAARATDAEGILRCEECHIDQTGKAVRYDHIKRDLDGGEPTLENAQVLCVGCHAIKTANENIETGKARRANSKHVGAKDKGAPIPQRPKGEKPPPKPLPKRQGGIFARFYGKEQ